MALAGILSGLQYAAGLRRGGCSLQCRPFRVGLTCVFSLFQAEQADVQEDVMMN